MISEVFYEVISPHKITSMEAGEYYYHTNMIKIDPSFIPGYEEFEEKQIQIRNELIRSAIERGVMSAHVRPDTSILAISPLKDRVVLIVK